MWRISLLLTTTTTTGFRLQKFAQVVALHGDIFYARLNSYKMKMTMNLKVANKAQDPPVRGAGQTRLPRQI